MMPDGQTRDEFHDDLAREEAEDHCPYDESNSEPDDRSCAC